MGKKGHADSGAAAVATAVVTAETTAPAADTIMASVAGAGVATVRIAGDPTGATVRRIEPW